MVTSSDSQKKPKRLSSKRETYRANEAIFNEGDRGDCAYMIKEDRVEIRMGSRGSNLHVIAMQK